MKTMFLDTRLFLLFKRYASLWVTLIEDIFDGETIQFPAQPYIWGSAV